MIKILAGIGFILSVYALYVGYKMKKSKSYSPLCDIKSNVSYSKAFTSKYGRLAGFPNPILGMVYYPAIFFVSQDYIPYISMPAVFLSVYLAYVSYIQQKNFCMVCSAIYLTNLLIFLASVTL